MELVLKEFSEMLSFSMLEQDGSITFGQHVQQNKVVLGLGTEL